MRACGSPWLFCSFAAAGDIDLIGFSLPDDHAAVIATPAHTHKKSYTTGCPCRGQSLVTAQ